MATKRHLSNAPIREALVEVRPAPLAPMSAIQAFASAVAAEKGGRVADLWQTRTEIKMEDGQMGGPSNTHSASLVGKRVDFTSYPEVAQFRTDGFTYSRLAPYETWEAMAERAFPLWASFAEAAGFASIGRVALRYINTLQLLLPIEDFAHFLMAPPQIPEKLPQEVAGYMQRISFMRDRDTATVTQVLEPVVAGSDSANVLLDIEIVTDCHIEAREIDALKLIANRLREFKNDVFFEFVTERAIARYS